jgi:hypothetical protein
VNTVELYGPEGLLDSKTFGAKPYVDIYWPENNGVIPEGEVEAVWKGYDLDGEEGLLYTLLYSTDGENWIDYVFEEPVERGTVPLSKSSVHYIKVIVTDGTQSGEDMVRFNTSAELEPGSVVYVPYIEDDGGFYGDDEPYPDDYPYDYGYPPHQPPDTTCCFPGIFLIAIGLFVFSERYSKGVGK